MAIENFEANKKFTKAFQVFVSQFGILWQYMSISYLGIPKAEGDYYLEMKESFDQLRPGGKEDGLLLAPQEYFDSGEFDKFIDNSIKLSIIDSLKVVDSASIVISHSIFDSHLFSLIKILEFVEPKEFCKEKVGNKKISISDVFNIDEDELIRNTNDGLLEKIERESLIMKMEYIHSICKPDSTFQSMKNYYYDIEKLKEFDESRHKIVHDPQFKLEVKNADELLQYIHKTGLHFWKMLNWKYGLKMMFDDKTKQPIT